MAKAKRKRSRVTTTTTTKTVRTVIQNPLRLGKQDKAVIRAFTERRALDGHKLTTNGTRLDGYWMGGNELAVWRDGKIHLPDTGGRSGQAVQNAVRREAPKNDLFNDRGWNPPRPKFKLGDKVEDVDGSRRGEVSFVGQYDDFLGGYRYKVLESDGTRNNWNETSMRRTSRNPAPRFRIESDEATRAERDKIYTDAAQAHRDADRIRRRGPSAYADVQVDYGEGVWEAHEQRNPESRISLTSIGPLSKRDAHKELTKLKRGREGQWIEEETPRGRPWDTESLRRFRNNDEWIEIFQDEGRRGKPWYVRTGKYTSMSRSNPGGQHVACGSEISDKDCRQLQHVYESAKDRGYSDERAAKQAWGSLRRNPRGAGKQLIRVPGAWLRRGMIVKAPEYVHDFFLDGEPKVMWQDWPAHARATRQPGGFHDWAPQESVFPDPMPMRLRVDAFDEDEDGESDLVAIDETGRELGVSFDWNTGAYPDIWLVEADSINDLDAAARRQGQYPPSAKNPTARATSLVRRIGGA